MTPELHALLVDRLAHGTPAQKRAARERLQYPDARSYSPPPSFRPAESPEIAPAAPQAAPMPVGESLAILSRMKACPDREPRADCGCAGLATCRRGNRIVNHHDCFACLSDSP